MKYKVAFDGFAYVEAETPEEAKELFRNDEVVYMETEISGVDLLDEFFVML